MSDNHGHTHDHAHEHAHEHIHEHTHIDENGHEYTHTHVHADGSHSHDHGHIHSAEHTRAVLNRMARIIGHMESTRRMVEAVKNDDVAAIEELNNAIDKFIR